MGWGATLLTCSIQGWNLYLNVMKESSWITLDYLEFFCQRNQMMIGCRSSHDEIWISALGPEPNELSVDEVRDILRESSIFELRNMLQDDETLIDESLLLTRKELEQRLKVLMN
jgi:hypothetical protein